jgi:hypothetical protein
MPAFAIESMFGVLMIELPLKPVSPQPKSSAIQRIMFGLLELLISEKADGARSIEIVL